MCKRKAEWDDKLTDEESKTFTKWLSILELAKNIGIDRPLPIIMASRVKLRHFCDASEKAYAAVSYLRTIQANCVNVSFVFAKSRLAPLKKVSIQRLELTSAVLAVKHDKMLREEMRIRLDSSTFWTDSQITLHCINNTDKRFNVFVANRLSAIQDSTTAKQWHWCPTKLNPADDATRGMKPTELEKRWITDPEFLQKETIDYPTSPSNVDHPDVEQQSSFQATYIESKTDQFIKRYSSFNRLARATGLLRRFIAFRSNKRDKSRLNLQEIKSARMRIIGYVQRIA